MITINGIRYAKNDNEFNESLFSVGGTCNGYYKKLKNRIEFLDKDKNLFAALIVNKPYFCGIVNASKISGKNFYQHAASDSVNEMLGVPNGYKAAIEYADWLYLNIINARN